MMRVLLVGFLIFSFASSSFAATQPRAGGDSSQINWKHPIKDVVSASTTVVGTAKARVAEITESLTVQATSHLKNASAETVSTSILNASKTGTAITSAGNIVIADDKTLGTASTYLTFDNGNDISVTGGNVGIGTASPGTNLEVFTDASAEGILIKGVGDTWVDFNMDANRTSAGYTLSRTRFLWNGTAVAEINAFTGDDTTNKDEGDLIFRTANGGSMGTRMTITQEGNVGIGTTSPDELLDVYGSGGPAVGIRLTSQSNTDFDQTISFWRGATPSARWTIGNTGSDNKFRIATGATLDGGNDVMTLDDGTGNVGIGTAGPDRKLDILDGSNPQLRLSQADGTAYAELKADSSGVLYLTSSNSGYHALSIGQDDTVKGVLTLYSLGTGNTAGGVIDIAVAADYDTTIGYYELSVSSDDLLLGPATNKDALKYDGGNNDWLFTQAGNVGIGTASPLRKLHVVGDGILANTNPILSFTGADGVIDEVSLYYIDADNDLHIRDNNAGVNRVTFEKAGNVGIATDTPGYKLSVAGTLGCQSLTEYSISKIKRDIQPENTIEKRLEAVGRVRQAELVSYLPVAMGGTVIPTKKGGVRFAERRHRSVLADAETTSENWRSYDEYGNLQGIFPSAIRADLLDTCKYLLEENQQQNKLIAQILTRLDAAEAEIEALKKERVIVR